ncbi:MAG: hypothetical protein ACRCUS_10540 [Anaerovoracaceae bacterium]
MTTISEISAITNIGSFTLQGDDVRISTQTLLGKSITLNTPIESILFYLLYQYLKLNNNGNISYDFPRFINGLVELQARGSFDVLLREGGSFAPTPTPTPTPTPSDFTLSNLFVFVDGARVSDGSTITTTMDTEAAKEIYIGHNSLISRQAVISLDEGTATGDSIFLPAFTNNTIASIPTTLSYPLNTAYTETVTIIIDGLFFSFDINLNQFVSFAIFITNTLPITINDSLDFNWIINEPLVGDEFWQIAYAGGALVQSEPIFEQIGQRGIDIATLLLPAGYYVLSLASGGLIRATINFEVVT